MSSNQDTLKELLIQYTYYYGVRSNNTEKTKCYTYIIKKYEEELGYKVTFDNISTKIVKAGVCIIGDISKAKQVIVLPFDTPKKSYYMGYKFFPFDSKKNLSNDICATIANFIVGFSIAFLCIFISYILFRNLIVTGIITVLGMLIYLFSLRNVFNFTKSSISLALANYVAIKRKKSDKYFYVFVDNCSNNYVGLKLFLERYEKQLNNKRILFLDCLASGSQLVLAGKSNLSIPEDLDVTILDSFETPPVCLDINKNLTMLLTGELNNHDFYVENIRSKRDRKVDIPRLVKISEWLLKAQ